MAGFSDSISPTFSTAWRSVATSCRASRPRSHCSTNRWRSQSDRVCRAICCARTFRSAARDATAACVTTSPPTTTWSGRSNLRRSWVIARQLRTRTSRPRSCHSGRATTFLAQLRAAGEGAVPTAERRPQRRPASPHARRADLPLGDEDSAVEQLKASYSRALDTDSRRTPHRRSRGSPGFT